MTNRPTRYKTLRGERARLTWKPTLKVDGVIISGDYDEITGEIRINTGRTHQWQGLSILHELTHHCMDTLTLSPRDHYTIDEMIVDCASRGLSRLWRNNPELFALINDLLTGQVKDGEP